MSISLSDGKIYCTFIRDAVTKLILPNGLGEATIDLDSVGYFVELASGPLISAQQINRHQGASVTDTAIRFKNDESSSESPLTTTSTPSTRAPSSSALRFSGPEEDEEPQGAFAETHSCDLQQVSSYDLPTSI